MKTISRHEQLERWRQRYRERGVEGKARLLDELCQDYGYHRKHVIRLLNSTGTVKKSPPGPESKYEGLVEVVRRIWVGAVSLAAFIRPWKRSACESFCAARNQ